MTAYRLFPSTNGPANAVSYSGNFIAGIQFEVTAGATWFQGYWWWVASGSPAGPLAPQKFALWAASTSSAGSVVPGSVTGSGPLAAGWNFIPLATPVPLATGADYIAATGVNGNFNATDNSFGAADTYAAGITNGPLNAFSAASGSNVAPLSIAQGVFATAGTDPAAVIPLEGSTDTNFWIDVQVTSVVPAGTSYRWWPSYPVIPPSTNGDNFEQTFGNEFTLGQACTLNRIWFYSPPLATALPAKCGIWAVAGHTVVPGTENDSPSWSGLAASGWVSCSYSGVTLPAGDYKVTVYTTGGTTNFYQETELYWASPGPGASSITAGPLTGLSDSAATSPGQGTYTHGGWLYPATTDTGGDAGQNRWVDIEVTPPPPPLPPPPLHGPVRARVFRAGG